MSWILLVILEFTAIWTFGVLWLNERGKRLNKQRIDTKIIQERDDAFAELEKQKAAINTYLLKPVQISLSDLQLELVAYHVAEKMKEVDKRLLN